MTRLSCEKPTLFKGRHFNHVLIIQAVRWHVTYELSYRDVCDLMLGFKTFGNAGVTLSGIELADEIKKGQFDTSEITGPRGMILQVWEAALAA
jgi:transposase-like protein